SEARLRRCDGKSNSCPLVVLSVPYAVLEAFGFGPQRFGELFLVLRGTRGSGWGEDELGGVISRSELPGARELSIQLQAKQQYVIGHEEAEEASDDATKGPVHAEVQEIVEVSPETHADQREDKQRTHGARREQPETPLPDIRCDVIEKRDEHLGEPKDHRPPQPCPQGQEVVEHEGAQAS